MRGFLGKFYRICRPIFRTFSLFLSAIKLVSPARRKAENIKLEISRWVEELLDPDKIDDDNIDFHFYHTLIGLCDNWQGEIGGEIKDRKFFSLFPLLGALIFVHIIMLLVAVPFIVFSQTKNFVESLKIGEFRFKDPQVRILHFTDTFYETNGPAIWNQTLQTFADSQRSSRFQYSIVTCSLPGQKKLSSEILFAPIGIKKMPQYENLSVFWPPLLSMLDFCFRKRVQHIHTTTPGPIGIAGLIISHILRIPVSTTYHTALPEYVYQFTGEKILKAAAWGWMWLFYNLHHRVYVPSEDFKTRLIKKGINPNKIIILKRGVNLGLFKPDPEKIPNSKCVLLYTGRVSKEKNLHLLIQMMKWLNENSGGYELRIVGDGPYKKEMEEICRQEELANIKFFGFLKGMALVKAYQQADIFIFPSTTDTFGNVILEAKACGLPVVVTDAGGPKENITDGYDGAVVEGDNVEALIEDINRILEIGLAEAGHNALKSTEKQDINQSCKTFIESLLKVETNGRDNSLISLPWAA